MQKNYNSSWPKIWKKEGFSHVRIRFNENTNLQTLKQAVEDSLKAWLMPVVSFWANIYKENPTDENLQKEAEIWQKVANLLKDTSYKVSFDLMIEPGKKLNKRPDLLNKYYETIIPIIRNTWWNNQNRIIFIAPKTRSHPDYLNLLKPVLDKFKNDKYLMVEFHFFAAGPSRTSRYLTWTTWTPEERQKIISKFKLALDFQKQTWRRIWFGAWMPGNYNHTYDKWNNYFSPEEQIKFSTFMISQMCKNHIPNAINADTQFYDYKNNTWKWTKKEVLDKIVNYWKKYCW